MVNMISKAEIKKLADLARIDIKEAEQDELASEMEAILDYVGQIKEITGEAIEEDNQIGPLRNVMRLDENPNDSETYSQALIAEFPKSENNYLKVKKIL